MRPHGRHASFSKAVNGARNYISVLFAVILFVGCSYDPSLPRLNQDDVIVAFGDSLTYGTGADTQTAYPTVLSAMIDRTVVNAGVPGETTTDAIARLPQVLDQHHPKLVLLCLGGNDMLRKIPLSTIEHNLRAMIRSIQASGASVVLIGVPEPALFGGAPAFYATIAGELKLPYEGEVFNDVLRNPSLKSDPIHANAEGYRLVAQRLTELLKSYGAL